MATAKAKPPTHAKQVARLLELMDAPFAAELRLRSRNVVAENETAPWLSRRRS